MSSLPIIFEEDVTLVNASVADMVEADLREENVVVRAYNDKLREARAAVSDLKTNLEVFGRLLNRERDRDARTVLMGEIRAKWRDLQSCLLQMRPLHRRSPRQLGCWTSDLLDLQVEYHRGVLMAKALHRQAGLSEDLIDSLVRTMTRREGPIDREDPTSFFNESNRYYTGIFSYARA